MATLDFPSSPIDGQTYTSGSTTWVYDSTRGKWLIQSLISSLNDLSDAFNDLSSLGLGANTLINDDGTNNKNTTVGNYSMVSVTSGNNNAALGSTALYSMTTGFNNVAIGAESSNNLTTAQSNVSVGHGTLQGVTTSGFNTAIGRVALQRGNGEMNTGAGFASLSNFSFSGSYNTALGAQAGDALTSGNYNIIIGYNADASSSTVANEITLGNTSITRFRIPGAGIDNTSAALSGTTPSVNVGARDTYTLTTSGNTTFTFTGAPSSGQVGTFSLIITAGGTHTLTWPASVDWAGGTAPDAPASGTKNIYTFMSIDAGTTWYGFLAGGAMA